MPTIPQQAEAALQTLQPWLEDRAALMLERTIELANINSGSFNRDGVNQVRERIAEYAQTLDADIAIRPVAPFSRINAQGEQETIALGDALTLRKRPDAPLQLFFCAHLDTVFPVDSSFQSVRWLDDNTLNGPGVTDLKGGIVLMLTALEALERSPLAARIGWTVLLNPDEEIGSLSSAPLIEELSKPAQLGLIYEPCYANGNLAGQRKGSGNFSVVCKGVAAHAGREHHKGRNAVRALCEFVVALDDLNGQRAGVTINPARIEGGSANNVVPDLCTHHFNIRLERPEDEHWCHTELDKICQRINQADGISLTLHGGFGRKPKLLSDTNIKLLELVRACGSAVGVTLDWEATGGCCDGNNLAALGIANVDTLGVQGGAIHSTDEYLVVSSLLERAKLNTLLLLSLAASSPDDWPRDNASIKGTTA